MTPEKLFGLTGKRALITGSTRGLGWVFAQGMAAAGATVIVNGTNEGLVEQRQAELAEGGFEAHGYTFDVTREGDVKGAVKRIEEQVGPIDVLVNCAGINRRGASVTYDARDWDAVLDINLKGTWMVSRTVARLMIRRHTGKIINMASLLSYGGRPTVAAYAASKGGVALLTKTLAVEWAPHNIQVNAIAPGYFQTDMTTALAADAEFDAWVKLRTPAGRWGKPEELVGLLLFFAGEASSFVTGQMMAVDGGWTANL